jgi:hypothetical protein
MTKKIKNIGMKRALLSEIFAARNKAVRALDQDNESEYNKFVVELYDLTRKLEAI